jgi:hypothetical protein
MADKIYNGRVYTRKPLETRFWQKVDKNGINGCWTWTGGKSEGYGRIKGDSPDQWDFAHRLSWIFHHGPIPDDLFVCHRCDNRECTNPDHLFLGTSADNLEDMRIKGRGSPPPIHKGERHHLVKIPDSELPNIRASTLGRRVLAAKYGVHPATIDNIRNGKWRK